MMLIEKIRHATRPMHEELDKEMMPRIKNIHTADDYICLLTAFYGFFRPVYDAIDEHLQISFLPDYTERRATGTIIENLAALHYHLPIETTCQQLPRIYDNASAFGALYVMEGSTLGGLVIKKMIAEQTGMADGQLSFFAGYGKDTRRRWETFISALNTMAQNAGEEDNTVAAAQESFACFGDWLRISYKRDAVK